MSSFVFQSPFARTGMRYFASLSGGLIVYFYLNLRDLLFREFVSSFSGVCAASLSYIILKTWFSQKVTFSPDRMFFEGFDGYPPTILASSISDIQIVQPARYRDGPKVNFLIRDTGQRCEIPKMSGENWGEVIEWFEGVRLKESVTKK